MNSRVLPSFLGISVALLMALACGSGQADEHKHAGHMEECAKACALCMRECESCSDHCARLLASGKIEHLATLQTCTDCADICATAAKITSRHGPMAVTICEACAKSCDTCGAACQKNATDKHMQECANACRTCALACREMIKHIGHEQESAKAD